MNPFIAAKLIIALCNLSGAGNRRSMRMVDIWAQTRWYRKRV